jgi:hypothetical protein
MKTTKTLARAALAALIAVGMATAAPTSSLALTLTVDPAAVTVQLVGASDFTATYRAETLGGACSAFGDFNTELLATGRAVSLGVINRVLENPVGATGVGTLRELVSIPAGVIDEVKRRRLTRPIYFTRQWINCGRGGPLGATEMQITFVLPTVAAAPATAQISAVTDAVVPVRWKASFGEAASARVESPEGRFLDSRGRVYGTAARSLLQGSGRSPLELRESVRVPEEVVRAVLDAGESRIVYERSFTVDGVPVVGTLQLNFAGRVAAPFTIDRAEVRFLDGSRFATVPLNGEVVVEADITFSGSGRLRGSWDLAGPTSTTGAATFVRRELVDEHLSFGRRKLLRSPAIRVELPGVYFMRFSVAEPDLGAAGTLQLSFVALATEAAVAIVLEQPQPLATLAPDLTFSWKSVPRTRNYLLEFYAAPAAAGEPAAGLVLPGGEARASLSQAAAHNLKPGRSYWWRVVALGPEGILLGQSQLRELRAPQK